MSDDEEPLLAGIDSALSRGRDLLRFWDTARGVRGHEQRFELAVAFNKPESSYGFFDTARVDGRPMRVMGNFQEMYYDQPKSPPEKSSLAARWMRDQLREFVLRYFMRVSDFRPPAAYVPENRQPPPSFAAPFSLCGGSEPARLGFGFSQLYFKLSGSAEIGRFAEEDRYAIVDLREIGTKYEWIVVKVNIFDFSFFLPFDVSGPHVVLPLAEESHLVISREFISDANGGQAGELGHYGLGYAFIKNPEAGVVAYGPGEFDAAIELIDFYVLADGRVRVAMAFVANRPAKVANVSVDPIDWALRITDLFSLGLASRSFAPWRDLAERLPMRHWSVDPIYSGISLLNLMTAGLAARALCISREHLDRIFLLKHFMHHHQTISATLQTWRQIPDWLDAAALPDWVLNGQTS
jgi:hypothetical protein